MKFDLSFTFNALRKFYFSSGVFLLMLSWCDSLTVPVVVLVSRSYTINLLSSGDISSSSGNADVAAAE